MAFTLVCCDCSADSKRVNKQPFITELYRLSLDQLEARDLINPTFTVALRENMPTTFNYAYCPDIGKYYFVLTQVQKQAAKVIIQCKLDVRMTFLNNNLIDFPLTVLRNQFSIDSNVIDSELPINPSYHDFEILEIPTDLFALNDNGVIYPRQYDVLEVTGGAKYVN